ncbi:MAG: hypothetical protein Q9183_002112 [Haloplaca sp. 2 TL-2023]
MSQALLKAARSGEITKKAPPQPSLEDDKENAEEDDVVGDFDSAFSAKRWAAVPRHLEGPEPEFLAKRRKGLPSAYAASTSQANGAISMRKTRVRKVDADGNAFVLEVLVPEGQKVDGEVVEDEVNVTQAPAPGTVVEGVGVANAEGVIVAGEQALPAPPRRRPPPPKRKAKGPGRGRRKKVAFAPGAEGLNVDRSVPDGIEGSGGISGGVGAQEGAVHADGHVIMGDNLAPQNGEESSEEDDEGEEGDEDDREEGELSSSPTSAPSPPKEPPLVEHPQEAQPLAGEIRRSQDQTTPSELPGAISPITDPAAQRDTSNSPNLPLASAQAKAADEELAALSTMSNAMDERITAPQNEEQLLTVEEPSDSVDPASKDIPVAAEIPPQHNPLDGLAAPEIGSLDQNLEEREANASDGEVDLLGSLEQQLNRNEGTASTTA